MALAEPLILYTAKICPFAHRVELALAEAGAKDFTRYEIDLQNKPEWYQSKVNSASKVPAIVYGGLPNSSPSSPSPSSHKLAESLVLLEFIADLFPNSTLLPTSPVPRARVRFFIDAFANKVQPGYFALLFRGEAPDALYKGIEELQELLPEDGKFAVGNEFTVADAAVLPFIARMEVALVNEIGLWDEGAGRKIYDTLTGDKKYEKFWKYYEGLKGRDSFRETYDEDYIKVAFTKRFADLKAQKKNA